MIPADKNPLLDELLYLYLLRSLRRTFYSVEVRGLDHYRTLTRKRPTIAFANHTNWWDGLMIFFLTRFNRRKDTYCMMDERQLRQYKFFTWLGAFSTDVENPIRSAASIRYALRILREPSTLLAIFPQGKMESPYREIETAKGAHFLARSVSDGQMLPLTFRYEFFREQRPTVLINIGEPFPTIESSPERIRDTLRQLAHEQEQACRTGNFNGYERALRPSLSINKKWDWFRHLVTGRIRHFDPEN